MKTEVKQEKQEEVSLLKLFVVFLKIGAFTFGGGYVMLPLIQRELVDCKCWLEEEEFYDVLILIQGLPGPVALNCSLLTAKKLKGYQGGLVAALGILIPSLVIIISIAAFLFPVVRDNYYVEAAFYGIRPAVTALVAMAAFRMGRELIQDYFGLAMLALLFTVGLWVEIHPIFLLLTGGLAGWIYYYQHRAGEKQ